jgi:hypothetical protein
MFTKPQDFAMSGINSALFFANTTFDGIERLALLNLAAARSVFEGTMSNITALLGAKDVNSFVSLQKQLASPSNAQVSGLVEKALASAPAGSEVAVAAVKTAIKSANEAYEGLNKAAKQAAEVAEASVAAATSATMKAAVAAPKAAAKKAA